MYVQNEKKYKCFIQRIFQVQSSGKVSLHDAHIQEHYVNIIFRIFSSPGRSPGRAIVLPPASALALASALKAALAAASALAKC